MTIVSGTWPEPGVQLTTPPFALVSVVTFPVRASVRLTCPPAAPAGPAGPMKSPWIVIRRAVPVLLARTYGRETWSSSGVEEAVPSGKTEKSQPVPEIGSSTTARYMPGQGPCGIGQLNVSVEGTIASYEPSALVLTVFSSRHLFGS